MSFTELVPVKLSAPISDISLLPTSNSVHQEPESALGPDFLNQVRGKAADTLDTNQLTIGEMLYDDNFGCANKELQQPYLASWHWNTM